LLDSLLQEMKILLLWLLLGLISFCQCGWNCAPGCECSWSRGKKTANCSMSGLTTIPFRFDDEIQNLILDKNPIAHLEARAFKHHPNLQKISMQHCSIQTIHEHAFEALRVLVEINLSNNNISNFRRNTFIGNNKLVNLNLSNNPIKQLASYVFPTLPNMKTIDLSNCLLETIHWSAFRNLGHSVEKILLNGNYLQSLPGDIFMTLTNLKHLELNQNPWKCDCKLSQFRNWVVQANLAGSPTSCKEPERLSGKLWKHVEKREFYCQTATSFFVQKPNYQHLAFKMLWAFMEMIFGPME